MRLIIHAGIHRTGTTALQYFLANNRLELALQGFAYPFEGVNHQQIAWALHRRKLRGEDLVARLEPLKRSQATTIILSGEDFSIHRKLDWLEALSEQYEVSCAFYLRRQDDWVMSWYNQHVKWPFDKRKSTLSPDEFLATIEDYYWLDYESLLDRWVNALGEQAVSVAVVERGHTTDVVRHFADTVGLDSTPLAYDDDHQNDSLPVQVLEIARHVGAFDMRPRERTILNSALRVALRDNVSGATTMYSPAERNAILDRFSKSNRAVAQRFFDRAQLFAESSVESDAPYFKFPEMDRDELLREWIGPLVRELARRVRRR